MVSIILHVSSNFTHSFAHISKTDANNSAEKGYTYIMARPRTFKLVSYPPPPPLEPGPLIKGGKGAIAEGITPPSDLFDSSSKCFNSF